MLDYLIFINQPFQELGFKNKIGATDIYLFDKHFFFLPKKRIRTSGGGEEVNKKNKLSTFDNVNLFTHYGRWKIKNDCTVKSN